MIYLIGAIMIVGIYSLLSKATTILNLVKQIADGVYDLNKEMGLIDKDTWPTPLTYHQEYDVVRQKVHQSVYWELVQENQWENHLKENYSKSEIKIASTLGGGLIAKRDKELEGIKKKLLASTESTKEILGKIVKHMKAFESESRSNKLNSTRGLYQRIYDHYVWEYEVTKRLLKEVREGIVFSHEEIERSYEYDLDDMEDL